MHGRTITSLPDGMMFSKAILLWTSSYFVRSVLTRRFGLVKIHLTANRGSTVCYRVVSSISGVNYGDVNQLLSVCSFSMALVVGVPLRSGRLSADTAVTGTARYLIDRRDTEFRNPDRFIRQARQTAAWEDAIIDRRGENLLGPKQKWNHNDTGGNQKTVVRNETVIQRQNEGKRLQPAPKQKSSTVGNQTVVVSQTSEGTVIFRDAEEFRELLSTHAQRVAEVQAMIEA